MHCHYCLLLSFNYPGIYTVNLRISPMGAYLFIIFFDEGLFEGGAYTRGGGAYRIRVYFKKTCLKDTLYFSLSFFVNI